MKITQDAPVQIWDQDTEQWEDKSCPECSTQLVWAILDEEGAAQNCPTCGWSSGAIEQEWGEAFSRQQDRRDEEDDDDTVYCPVCGGFGGESYGSDSGTCDTCGGSGRVGADWGEGEEEE